MFQYISCVPTFEFCDDFRPLMTSMYDSLFSRLQDNVAPVREAAATALGCIVSAYGMNEMHMEDNISILCIVCHLSLKFS